MTFLAAVVSQPNFALISRLSLREVAQKVVGTQLGWLHYILTPMLLLSVYTFVFSKLFAIRWGEADLGLGGFALRLFTGLIAFNFFAEVFNRSPRLVVSNASYVKKVVFPLEALVPIAIVSGMVGVLANYAVFFAAYAYFEGLPTSHALWLPVLWMPLVLCLAGLGWLLAALGVYLRDFDQFVGVLTTLLMFLTPIFYPLAMVPEPYKRLLALNPITYVIEEMRGVLFEARSPDPTSLATMMLVSLLVAQCGYWFFMRTRKGFADVL